jgi:hypothetical protein
LNGVTHEHIISANREDTNEFISRNRPHQQEKYDVPQTYYLQVLNTEESLRRYDYTNVTTPFCFKASPKFTVNHLTTKCNEVDGLETISKHVKYYYY